ncbi:hypothetical protein BDR07DRAFT_1444803 [Suillus spraguei]|nr:hypothetical protein BDR07DRAFT_1444803 [Suillus spraguei]
MVPRRITVRSIICPNYYYIYPHDSVPRSLGDENSMDWNNLQNSVIDAAKQHAQALKALESKNIQTLIMKSDQSGGRIILHHSLRCTTGISYLVIEAFPYILPGAGEGYRKAQ